MMKFSMVRQVLARTASHVHSIAVTLALTLLIILSGADVTRAQSAVTMTAALALSQSYQPGAWQPVRIQLRNGSDRAMDGVVLLPLAHPRTPSQMRLPVTAPPRSAVTVTLWGYFPGVTPANKRSP